MSATSSPAPAGDGWRVEPPLPADRGLVARLLEQCVRTDPALAPEVADGTQRAGAWLQRTRPVWSGVVVASERQPRTILGYADVVRVPGGPTGVAVADGAGGHRVRAVLLAPHAAATGVEDCLRAAAAAAIADLDAVAAPGAPVGAPVTAPGSGATTGTSTGPTTGTSTASAGTVVGAFVGVDQDGPAPRFAPVVAVRRTPVAALVGSLAIAATGVAAVLAVQVGVGPLGGVLPFLAPDVPVTTSTVDDPTDPADPDPAAPAPVQPVLDAGAPLAPLPDPGPGAGVPGPGGPGTDGPGGPSNPTPPAPPAPPADTPGVVSSLLDPVVSTLTTAVDGATGGALAPVTGTVEGTTDTATDLLDDTVDQVVGLLPAR